MTVDARLVDSIQVRFPDAILSTEGEWTLTLFPTRLVEVGEFLRDDRSCNASRISKISRSRIGDSVGFRMRCSRQIA